MEVSKLSVAALLVLSSAVAQAGDLPQHEQLTQELTAGIPVGGLLALEHLRQALIMGLPGKVPVPRAKRP